MKRLPRFLSLCMGAAFLLPMAACQPKTPKPEPKPETPILLFEIDEGLRNRELLGIYANDYTGLHDALDNIFEATAPLKEKYDVRYLLYCHYQYKETGFGNGDPAQPLNRVAPVLQECLSYMQEKGEKAYLEQYSSGVFSHQCGSAPITPSIPAVPVHYGDAEKTYGISMDAEALGALAETYESFAGIRFHELVGSDEKAELEISTAAIKAAVDMCKGNGLQLVWGDHSWDTIYTSPTVDEWKARIGYAVEVLGESLILNYSNNSWDAVKSLKMNPMLRETEYTGASFGYSVQAWFWQENDVASLNTAQKPKWYTAAYQDMPVELMAAFTLCGVNRGARLIQFEPTNYFFNYYLTGNHLLDDSFTEHGADYTGRITLARFIDLVMNEDAAIANDPMSFYTSSESSLDLNREEDPPKKYNQTTVGVLGEGNAFFDVYNNDKTKLHRADDNRFLDGLFEGELIGVSRINLTFGCRDELLVLRKNATGVVADFYYYNSCLLRSDDSLFAANERGDVVDFTCANLLSEKVSTLEGDPDEIVITRNKNGVLSYEIYKAESVSDSGHLWPFRYKYVGLLEDEGATGRALGYRFRNALKADETRVADCIAYFTANNDKLGIKLAYKMGTQTISLDTELSAGGEIIDYTTADVNLDSEDDIVVLVKRADGTHEVKAYVRSGTQFRESTSFSAQVGAGVERLFSMRTATYYNKALAY